LRKPARPPNPADAEAFEEGSVDVEVEVVALDIMLENVPARLMLAHDVSHRQQEELGARRAAKMDAVAQVAGEVANHFSHVFANIENDTSFLLQQPCDVDTSERS